MAGPNFRAGVMIVVTNADGQLLAFERCGQRGEWQLPQGGIDHGETPENAAWRELDEETGLGGDDVRLVDEYPYWTVYQWPSSYARKQRLGQAHRWFFFELIDDAIEPTPDGKEFCAWKWTTAHDLIGEVVEFRRHPYSQVLL